MIVPSISMGRSACVFEDNERWAICSSEYHCVASGLVDRSALGMFFRRKCWKVRIVSVLIGYFE